MQRLQKGDNVVIVSGNDKGQQGKIDRVLPDRDMVIVTGLNVVKKHVRSTPERAGGILTVEAPIHQSKVMPVDPETGKPTRVSYKVQDGKKVRVAKSGAVIEVQR